MAQIVAIRSVGKLGSFVRAFAQIPHRRNDFCLNPCSLNYRTASALLGHEFHQIAHSAHAIAL
jgi:hypothetical protein